MRFGNGRVYGKLPEPSGAPLIEPLNRAVVGQRNKLTHFDSLPQDSIIRWYPGHNLETGADRSPDELLRIAHTAEQHFAALEDTGIYVPKHQAFIGTNPNLGSPDVSSSCVLFNLVERIDGEGLHSYDHHGSRGEERSRQVMSQLTKSLVQYREWARTQPNILWDNSLPSQYALHLGKICLVDIDPLLTAHDTSQADVFDHRLAKLQKEYL